MGKKKGKGRGRTRRHGQKRKAEEDGRGSMRQMVSPPDSETSDHDGRRRERATLAVHTHDSRRSNVRSSMQDSLALWRIAHAGPDSRIVIQHFDRCQHVDNSTRSFGEWDAAATAGLTSQQLRVERVLRISFVKSMAIDWNIVCVNVVELVHSAKQRVRRSVPFLNHDAVMLQRARQRREHGGATYYVRAEHTPVYQSILGTWAHWSEQEARLAMEARDGSGVAKYDGHVAKMEAYAASLFDAFDDMRISDHHSHSWFPQIRAWLAGHPQHAGTPPRGHDDDDDEAGRRCESPSLLSDWVTADREEEVARLSRSKGVSAAEMRAHMHAIDVVSARMPAIKTQRNASCHQLTAYTLKQYVELLGDPRGVEMLATHWQPTPDELHMWTMTVRLFFGDLFAGGQCAYDDGDEDLQVYRIHNTTNDTYDRHRSHDGSPTAAGTLSETPTDEMA